MQLTGGEFDVIVIGTGRSGRETALAATRQGCSILLISLSPGTIASMMWSSSDETPLKQEQIQAFIPSGDEKEKNDNQPKVTIQTTLHQPDGESSMFVLQAQVRRTQHQHPDSDAPEALQTGKPQLSFGQSGSLREREIRIREKLLRRNNFLPPKPNGKKKNTGRAGTEPIEPAQENASSIYQQRNNYLRKKLLDRPGVRGKHGKIPPQPRRNEDRKETPKRNYTHAAKDAAPVLLSTSSKDAKGLSESFIPISRSRKKKQRTEGTAKIHPLTHRESPNHERDSAQNWFQSLVWEDSKGDKPSATRTEAESKKIPRTIKTKHADAGTEKKETMEESRFSPSPPYHQNASSEQRNERTDSEPSDNSRQRNKPVNSDSAREKKKISFIEKEQARMILEQSTGTLLKRESIQLEDPYGYNAWEDIMPFSREKENNGTLDALEKRRIALRGLRNLINNLG